MGSISTGVAVEVRDSGPPAGARDLALLQGDDRRGSAEHGGDVGGEEVLAVPRPTTSGDDTFAPTSTPGSPADSTTSEYAPSSRRPIARRRSDRAPVQRRLDQVRDHLGVGVGGEHVAVLLERARSAWWFSTIPLWMTATRPAQSRCGWAFSSVGGAVGGPTRVAHRRWCRRSARSAPSAESSSASLPARLRTVSPSPSTRDTRGVIPAILETPQTLQDDGKRLVGADVSDDAAHVVRA